MNVIAFPLCLEPLARMRMRLRDTHRRASFVYHAMTRRKDDTTGQSYKIGSHGNNSSGIIAGDLLTTDNRLLPFLR